MNGIINSMLNNIISDGLKSHIAKTVGDKIESKLTVRVNISDKPPKKKKVKNKIPMFKKNIKRKRG